MSTTILSTIAVHRLPLYNAGRLTDKEVGAAFAARRQVLERIIADLGAERADSRAQHHLIVGQRGMGKTMLLARIAAELRTGPLATRFIPLVFAEEQYAVDRLSKFWLNCLDSLADAQDRSGVKADVERIDAPVNRLTARPASAARDDAPLAREALDAFLQAVEATGRRPVLLVDNLQLVFERLDNVEQHFLRELLMRAGCPLLVGASPSPPPESQDYGAAFYDHFKVHYLRPLELAEMKAIMLHLAAASGRDAVRARVLQHPERLTVLHQLIGGNPRATVTLFLLYAEDFAPSVFDDLENLLDRVTPLCKARIEELSDQQQVLVSAIAGHWSPITSRVLSEATGLALNQISPQLDRLEKTGFVEKVELYDEARAGYQITDRFFNIWFLMRSGTRRQHRAVELFTRFLQTFHQAGDRDRSTWQLMEDRALSADLNNAVVAAHDANWGIARAALAKALEDAIQGFSANTIDNWMQVSAALVHLNCGAELIAFLEERGEHVRLRPWFEGLKAVHLGDRRYLQNVAPEVRSVAETLYDEIERRLTALPQKTRRRIGKKTKRGARMAQS